MDAEAAEPPPPLTPNGDDLVRSNTSRCRLTLLPLSSHTPALRDRFIISHITRGEGKEGVKQGCVIGIRVGAGVANLEGRSLDFRIIYPIILTHHNSFFSIFLTLFPSSRARYMKGDLLSAIEEAQHMMSSSMPTEL